MFICEVSRIHNTHFENDKNKFIAEIDLERIDLGSIRTTILKNGFDKEVGVLKTILAEH